MDAKRELHEICHNLLVLDQDGPLLVQSLAADPVQRESVLNVTIPRNEDILKLLDQLDSSIADNLESQWLDFKPWEGAKESMRVALEYAVCFANAATYHLNKAVSGNMHGKAAYTHSKGIDAIRYKELVRQFIVDHGFITPKDCRELLGFGESRTANSAISRLLTEWSASDGILRPEGYTANRKYFLRDERGEAQNG